MPSSKIDDLIDIIEGNRKFVKCLFVYNKIDQISLEEVDEIARKYYLNYIFIKKIFRPDSVVISCNYNLNMEFLLEKIWEKLALVRVYTKKV